MITFRGDSLLNFYVPVILASFLLSSSTLVIEDPSFCFLLLFLHSYPRHPMAPPQGACGRGCAPVPKSSGGRGLSERSEFRSPRNRDWGKGTPLGPRPGAHGFGSFCRNKRTSACGAETPQKPPLGVRGRNPAVPPCPSRTWLAGSNGSCVGLAHGVSDERALVHITNARKT